MIGLLGAYQAFQRQLKLADLKSNFVSSVSHELRAPIASVRLLAESLERGKITDEPKRQDYFRLIGQECRRLSGLIDNVLDFSRIDQGRKRYEFEPTDLRALVQQTVDLMEPKPSRATLGFGSESRWDSRGTEDREGDRPRGRPETTVRGPVTNVDRQSTRYRVALQPDRFPLARLTFRPQ